MAKNYFPVNYKPVYSMVKTRSYIARYLKKLFALIEKNRNAFYIDPPMVTSYRYNWDAFSANQRLITFDNKYSYELNQVYNDISNYMCHALLTSTTTTDVAVYTYLPVISRDGAAINKSMVNNNLYVEMYASHTPNHLDLTKQIIENFFTTIQTVNVQQAIGKNKNPEYTNQPIIFITIEKLIKVFPNISLAEAIDRFTIANGPTAVIGACLKINGKVLFSGLPTADNYNETVVLYVLNDNNNHATPIVKVTVRPTAEIVKQQILADIPEVLDDKTYLETVLSDRTTKTKKTIGMTVYFSNIMYINLKKYHISEIVHAPWPEDFMGYVAKNKIEIM